jgi:hypothetical protein
MRRRDVHAVVEEVLSRPTGRPITMMPPITISPRSPLPQLPDSDPSNVDKSVPRGPLERTPVENFSTWGVSTSWDLGSSPYSALADSCICPRCQQAFDAGSLIEKDVLIRYKVRIGKLR